MLRGRLLATAVVLAFTSLAFADSAFAGQSTAFQIDAQHSGSLQYQVAPPLSPLRTRELGHPDTGSSISYPIIAEGKVFVTV